MKKRIMTRFNAGLLGALALGGMLVWSGAALAQQQPGQSKAQQQDSRQMQERMLVDEVYVRLANSPSIDVSNIDIKGHGEGLITLSGTVATEQAKTRALRIARQTRGVRDVQDNLKVDRAAARQFEAVNDEELSRRVAQKLATETFPGGHTQQEWFGGWEVEGAYGFWEFDVEADGGVIELEGSVPFYGDIRKAVEAAREVPGVRSVTNQLYVNGYPTYGYPYYGYYGHPYHGYPYYGYYRD